jgi:hypothetical protein
MNSLNGNITNDGFGASQDIEGHLQYAQEMRSSIQENTNARSFAIIPDIIAIDIYSKHRIDVHSDEFLRSPQQAAKLQHIIKTEYPKLLTGGVSNRYSLGAL